MRARALGAALCALWAWGCQDQAPVVAGLVAGDCREAARACAAGFTCLQVEGGAYACTPTRVERDAAPAAPPPDADAALAPDAAIELDAAPDAAFVPDAAPEIDAALDAALAPDAAPRSPGAGPCVVDADCAEGTCERAPEGFCAVRCEGDADCATIGLCVEGFLGVAACHIECKDALDCRAGWFCDDTNPERATCQPACEQQGCPGGSLCDAVTQRCVPEVCAPAPEVCNGVDDDCDSAVDEGALNACGQCGDVPAEACNGRDDDCDGAVDDDAPCRAGTRCAGGRCVDLVGPAGPCDAPEACASGECNLMLPGGFCRQVCANSGDCAGGVCLAGDAANVCIDACETIDDCRAGWTCYPGTGCLPACRDDSGCSAGGYCDRGTGQCLVRTYTVQLSEVVLRPYIAADLSEWDGVDGASARLVNDLAAALFGADPYTLALGVIASLASAGNAAPDAFGTAELIVEGQRSAINLPEVGNQYRPRWNARWPGVPLGVVNDARLQVSLTDADLQFDDQIGTAVATFDDLLAAERAGGLYAVATYDAVPGGNNILFLIVQVIPEQ